jgi:hypothetical protein
MESTEIEVLERLAADTAHIADTNKGQGQWLWVSDESPIDKGIMGSLVHKGLVNILGRDKWLLAQMSWDGRNYIKEIEKSQCGYLNH